MFTGGNVLSLGYSWHANVGDNLISLAEDQVLESAKLSCRHRVPADAAGWLTLTQRYPSDGVVLHGGGNIGDLYPQENDARVALLNSDPGRPILQLPQSIHFVEGRNALALQRAIAAHRQFRLLVRDLSSLKWAEDNLECETFLVPDVAFVLDLRLPHVGNKDDALVLARADEEVDPNRGQVPAGVRVVDWMNEPPLRSDPRMFWRALRYRAKLPRWLDNYALRRLAVQRVNRGVRLCSSANTVVTDRLHGVILCTLLGIPVVAVDNSYHKVSGLLDTWELCEIANVRRARTFPEAVELAKSCEGPGTYVGPNGVN